MPKLIINPEHQIQRVNHLINKTESLQQLALERLITAKKPKSWNVLEVLEHLSIAFKLYEEKIEAALQKAPESQISPWKFKARRWQGFMIASQRPKGKKRPFKIKTLKRFEPLLQKNQMDKDGVEMVFQRFFDSYQRLKEQIIASRKKAMRHSTIVSAVGPIVRFYLPEAFEFLICHAERHMVQIEEILGHQK